MVMYADSGSSPLTRHLAAELAAGREDEMPADILELARSQSHGLPPDLTQESLPGVGSAGFPVGPLLSAASKATADVQAWASLPVEADCCSSQLPCKIACSWHLQPYHPPALPCAGLAWPCMVRVVLLLSRYM